MRSSAANSSVSVPASLRELCGDQAGPAAAPVPKLTSLQGMPDRVSKAACGGRRYLCCLFESEHLCVGSNCSKAACGSRRFHWWLSEFRCIICDGCNCVRRRPSAPIDVAAGDA